MTAVDVKHKILIRTKCIEFDYLPEGLLRFSVLRDVTAVLLGEQCAALCKIVMCSSSGAGRQADFLHSLTLKMKAS